MKKKERIAQLKNLAEIVEFELAAMQDGVKRLKINLRAIRDEIKILEEEK